MTDLKNIEALTIREIEYSIIIKDKNKGFREIAEILRSELTRFEVTRIKNGSFENPIRDFLKSNIDRSIAIRDNTRVYLTNYTESGSLTIQFTLLITTRYINYGTIRQALDYLIKDTIGAYFEEVLERHMPVSVLVHSVDTELYDIQGSQEMNHNKPRVKHDYFAIILASVALLLSMTLSFIWYSTKNQTTEANLPVNEYQDKYIELLIEKQVNEVLLKDRQNILSYENLVSSSDTNHPILDVKK